MKRNVYIWDGHITAELLKQKKTEEQMHPNKFSTTIKKVY